MTDVQRQIIAYLLAVNSPCTVGKLSKALNEPPSKLEYHLQKLTEKGILLTVNPPPTGARKYGVKYYLNPKFKPDPSKTFTLLIVTLGLFLAGLLTIPLNPLYAAIYLTPSSFVGAYYTLQNYRKQHHKAIDEISNALK